MKKIRLFLELFLFGVIILWCGKVNGASLTLSPNKSNVIVGEEFTISMNLSGASLASLDARIAVDTSKVEYISSSAPNNTNFNNGRIIYTWTDASGGANPKTSGTIVTFRLKAKSKGTASFSLTGKFYDSDENIVNINLTGTSIIINEETTTPEPPTPPPEEPQVTPEPEPEQTPNEPEVPNNNNNNTRRNTYKS